MKYKFLSIAGIVGLLFLLFGAWAKILHLSFANTALTIGFIVFGVFWIGTLWDILNATFAKQHEKMLWLLLAIFAPLFGCMIYLYFNNKKRMAQ